MFLNFRVNCSRFWKFVHVLSAIYYHLRSSWMSILCSIPHLVPHCIVWEELSGSTVGGHCCLHKEVCSPATFSKCRLNVNQLWSMTWIWLKTNGTYEFRIIPWFFTRHTNLQRCYLKLNADQTHSPNDSWKTFKAGAPGNSSGWKSFLTWTPMFDPTSKYTW